MLRAGCLPPLARSNAFIRPRILQEKNDQSTATFVASKINASAKTGHAVNKLRYEALDENTMPARLVTWYPRKSKMQIRLLHLIRSGSIHFRQF